MAGVLQERCPCRIVVQLMLDDVGRGVGHVFAPRCLRMRSAKPLNAVLHVTAAVAEQFSRNHPGLLAQFQQLLFDHRAVRPLNRLDHPCGKVLMLQLGRAVLIRSLRLPGG